jgi:hypothetical protein
VELYFRRIHRFDDIVCQRRHLQQHGKAYQLIDSLALIVKWSLSLQADPPHGLAWFMPPFVATHWEVSLRGGHLIVIQE